MGGPGATWLVTSTTSLPPFQCSDTPKACNWNYVPAGSPTFTVQNSGGRHVREVNTGMGVEAISQQHPGLASIQVHCAAVSMAGASM